MREDFYLGSLKYTGEKSREDRNMTAFVRLLVSLVAIGWATTSGATLTLEPVINSVLGSGQTANSFPLYDPTSVNAANGEHPFLANQPGEIDTVSIGNPPDPDLLIFSVWNNTTYNITSLKYSIIGSASHPTNTEDAWLVTRDPSVDAFFGDADSDGKIGLSNIFSSIVVSDGGKTITLSGGLIPRDGHFTDIFHASTTDGLPFFAGVDTSFGGVLVPEPSTWAMMVLGFAGLGFAGWRRAGRNAGLPWLKSRIR
jgi:PEP-CTERM motif-containing protein